MVEVDRAKSTHDLAHCTLRAEQQCLERALAGAEWLAKGAGQAVTF